MDTEQPKLVRPKVQLFAEEYLRCWSQSEAARVAGYKSPLKQGWQLFNRPDVQEYIKWRLAQSAMPANEILSRITQHARVNVGDFFHYKQEDVLDENGQPVIDPNTGEVKTRTVLNGLNWEMFRKYGFLIKKLSWSRTGQPVLEVVDSQKALELLGRHYQLFVDRLEIDPGAVLKAYIGISPDDWDETEP